MRPRRALFCAPLMPEFDRESGSKRIFDLVDFLRAGGWAVTFVSRQSAAPRYAEALQRRGVATYAGVTAPDEKLIVHGGFDLAVLAFWYVAEDYLPILRRLSPGTRVLVDSIDLHFVRYARQAFLRSAAPAEAGQLGSGFASEMTREINTYAAADGVMTVSAKEADLIQDLIGLPGLGHVVPDGEEVPPSPVPFDRRRGILFVGNFKHAPNVGAVEFLCKQVLPHVDPALLKAHPVHIVGNALDDRIRRFGAGLPDVHMVGWVPSVLPYLHQARVMAVPLLYGAGTKRKLLQSLMAGTPAVSTTVGAEGLHLVDGNHLLVADDPIKFAASLTRLLADQRLWKRLATNARAHALSGHGRAVAQSRFLEAVDGVMAREPKGPPPGGASATPGDDYDAVVARVRELAPTVLPAGANVLVVSKGDERLLRLEGLQASHFPQALSGAYAGHHPADSAAAVAHIEALRSRGAQYLLIPATSTWWLNFYVGLRAYLEENAQLALGRDDACVIYRLAGAPSAPVAEGIPAMRAG